jgi:predicted permease
MSSVGLDFTGLFTALGIGAVCALLGTPLLWRLGKGLPVVRRAVLAVLAALGLAGLAAAFASYSLRDRELAAFAIGFTILLQLVALPVLLLVERRAPKA